MVRHVSNTNRWFILRRVISVYDFKLYLMIKNITFAKLSFGTFFWWIMCLYHDPLRAAAFTKEGNVCDIGHFKLPTLESCMPYLNCSDWKNFKLRHILGEGYIKQVFLVDWMDQSFALNILKNEQFATDFFHGLKMISLFQPSNYVTQLVGVCGDQYLTEYHKLGSAGNFHKIIKSYEEHNNLFTRFNMCINFIEVLNFLHNSPVGKAVMCDANSLDKMLSQFLITDDFQLIANDLDALPIVEGNGIKCGKKQIFGNFVAPEQLWPYTNKTFEDNDMPSYDEKIDIWKVPDVCQFFISNVRDGNILSFYLFEINKLCKDVLPKKRPNAKHLLLEYQRIQKRLLLMDEL